MAAHEAEREPEVEMTSDPECYVLCLYVLGASAASLRAVTALGEICRTVGASRFALEVVDLQRQPDLGVEEGIVAMPTLVRRTPQPGRRVVGDLSDRSRVIATLGLRPAV